MGQELLLEVVFDFSIGLVEDDEDFGDGKGLELFEQVEDDFFVGDGQIGGRVVFGEGVQVDVLVGGVDDGEVMVLGVIDHVE